MFLALTVVVLVIAPVLAAALVMSRPPSSTRPDATPAAIPTTTSPSLPTAPAVSPSPQPTSLVFDPATIAATVDDALVDITETLGTQGTAAATGMILTSTGLVLTNNHVVRGATSISVQVTGTGPRYGATVIGVDPTDDVALIQMTGASGLPTVPLGNSSTVAVGDPIVVIGNAMGLGGTPAWAAGVVTALDQTITATDSDGANPETLSGMIQVQAAVLEGDSGGATVDASGHVIGMTTAGSGRSHRSGSVGFSIPINAALAFAQRIEAGAGTNP